MEFSQAIRVFVEGFSFTRSFTHPCLYESLGESAFRIHDAPRTRKSDKYRSEELVTFGISPAEVLSLSQSSMGKPHKICYLLREGEPDTEIRREFKSAGCRLMGTEPFLVHSLENIPTVPEPVPIVRVTTPEQAQLLASAALRRQVLPEHLSLDPPPIRQYMALEGEKYPVGWVASVVTTHGAWCSSMFVRESQRRKGIGRSLMTRMLLDDRAAGVKSNVLLASHTGAKLYEALGYKALGMLYLYAPPKN
jgi:GNAT superfamily N-acetyltransferase